MKSSEMRLLSIKELETKLYELKEEYFNLRFRHAANQLEKNSSLKTIKKDIARLNTIITEKL